MIVRSCRYEQSNIFNDDLPFIYQAEVGLSEET